MKWYKTLQSRIFLSMLLLVALISLMMIVMAIIQYRAQAEVYHLSRLERKESAIKRDIQYHLDNANDFLITERLPYIFKDKIYALSHVHNLEIGIYDMDGKMLKSSRASLQFDEKEGRIPIKILADLKSDVNHRVVKDTLFDNDDYLSIYSYIYDNTFTPIGILNIPYLGKTNFYQNELKQLLIKISYVFIIAILISVALAYLLSRVISSPLKEIAESMKETRLYKQNKKITTSFSGTEELYGLINAYNGMIDELESNAIKLAQGERERAWREMAKQVAHEIKNPLTPMRLSIQSFEQRFDPRDPNIKEKVSDLSQSLIQQVDTMTAIASAFSDFAKMPVANKELINIVEVIDHTLELFGEEYITFTSTNDTIHALFDRNQLVRIINNLITNAQQAMTEQENPQINVVLEDSDDQIEIKVADNGKGIAYANREKIFEPKFTTKSSGMGLGLGMVRNILKTYNGTISFTSKEGVGTTFTIKIPK